MDIRTGLEVFFVLMLGLLYGSFASALIWRIPRGISWVYQKNHGAARSACPRCGHRLGLFDLIPVLSWAAMRGRCRYCRAPIGWVYPLVELTTMLLCVGVYALWGYGAPGMVVMLAVPFLLAAWVIDWRHSIFPNQINVIVFVLGVVYHLFSAGVVASAWAVLAGVLWGAGAFLFGFLMKKILNKECLGLGDVKFFAVCGVWLSAGAVPVFLMLAGGLGVVLAMVWRRAGRGDAFPFGPALIAALALCLVLGY